LIIFSAFKSLLGLLKENIDLKVLALLMDASKNVETFHEIFEQ
jgi:hypothetical protein